MPLIQWKSIWKSIRSSAPRMILPVLTAATLLVVSATEKTAVGSTARSVASNSPVLPIQNSMMLTCQIESFATMIGDSKSIQGKISPGSAPLTFRVVDGHLFKFDPGPMRLRLLSTSRTSASMFFELLTDFGDVQLWSFHRLQNGRILYSGQLSLNESGPSSEIAVALSVLISTQAGYCDATGGNGHPIRE
jgi:hypothetical protein